MNTTNNPSSTTCLTAIDIVVQSAEVTQVRVDPRIKVFNDAWDKIEREIPFNTAWKNGTGYLNYMVFPGYKQAGTEKDVSIHCGSVLDFPNPDLNKRKVVEFGQQGKGIDDYGRRFIFTSTRLGGIVVFERHSDGSKHVFVINRHYNLEHKGLRVGGSSAQSEEDLQDILGYYGGENIGLNIEKLYIALK